MMRTERSGVRLSARQARVGVRRPRYPEAVDDVAFALERAAGRVHLRVVGPIEVRVDRVGDRDVENSELIRIRDRFCFWFCFWRLVVTRQGVDRAVELVEQVASA